MSKRLQCLRLGGRESPPHRRQGSALGRPHWDLRERDRFVTGVFIGATVWEWTVQEILHGDPGWCGKGLESEAPWHRPLQPSPPSVSQR